MKRHLILGLFAALTFPVWGGLVTTNPEGYVTWNLPATTQVTSHYLSVPLTSTPEYASGVSGLTTNTITMSGVNWAPNSLAQPASPYFLRIVTGLQGGRTMLITGNTANTVTVDVSDDGPKMTNLNAVLFSLSTQDRVEIFRGDTLATFFGDHSLDNPLQLVGGTTPAAADLVGIYDNRTGSWNTYYFNTTDGFWENQSGAKVSANNKVIFPEAALCITRKIGRTATNIIWMGEIPRVIPRTKVLGGNTTAYTSSRYPVDIKLKDLRLSNWSKNDSITAADTISLYNPTLSKFDTYYLRKDGTWRRMNDALTDQGGVLIPAGVGFGISQRAINLNRDSSYIKIRMPYKP